MKLIAVMTMTCIAMTAAHAEQGDAEDRALIEQYVAHQKDTAPGVSGNALSSKKDTAHAVAASTPVATQ